MFQFQNGTIKRVAEGVAMITILKFQFQNGTIKRLLKILLISAISCFNSKMVRLKAQERYYLRLFYLPFQFQNGTIKSKCFDLAIVDPP